MEENLILDEVKNIIMIEVALKIGEGLGVHCGCWGIKLSVVL